MNSHSVAAETLRLQELVSLLKEEGVVDWGCQVDVTDVARAVINGHAAGWAG